MSTMDHGRFEELKDAYVLGALAEQERREFEEYLAAHPERQAEVDDALAAVVEHPVEITDTVAVTVEPEGGSPEPTSDPMLVAEVRA